MSETEKETKKRSPEEQAAYDDLVARINHTLNKLRPYIQADGGDVHFVDFEDGIVTVSMSGACAGCMALNTTLNDGIEALEISKNNLFSKAIEKSVETLLNEQKMKCREQYVTEKEHSDRAWEDIRKSFEETICQWLENYGERHYEFEFVRLNDAAAT